MKKSITRLASIAFLGNLFGKASRYGHTLIIAQLFGPGVLGQYALGLVVLRAAALVSEGGLRNSAERFISIAESKDDPGRVVGIIRIVLGVPFLIGGLIGIFLFIFWDQVPIIRTAAPDVGLLALGIPFFATMMTGSAATRGFTETKFSVLIHDITYSVGGLLLILIFGVFIGIQGALLGLVLALCSSVVVTIFSLNSLVRLSHSDAEYPLKKIFGFSLPLLFVAGMQYLVSWTDIVVLSGFHSSASVGIYQASFQTAALLVIVLHSVESVFSPVVASLYNDNKTDELERVYVATTKWITWLSLLGFVFLLVGGRDILRLFGASFSEGVLPLAVLSGGYVIVASTGSTYFMLSMTGNERLELLNTASVAILNLGLNLLLVPAHGILGAAVSTAISLSLLSALQIGEIRFLLGIHPYAREYTKGLLAVSSTFPVALIYNTIDLPRIIRLIFAGILMIVLFSIVLLMLGFDKYDRELLKAI